MYIDSEVKHSRGTTTIRRRRFIIATAPDSKAMTEMIGGLGPIGRLVLIGVSSNPIEVAPVELIRRQDY